MRGFSSVVLSLAALAALALPAAAAEKLTVYTYESFTADWGPGPGVKKAFEAQCACTVDFVSVEDGVALLNRVKLEGASTKADIVLGLSTHRWMTTAIERVKLPAVEAHYAAMQARPAGAKYLGQATP